MSFNSKMAIKIRDFPRLFKSRSFKCLKYVIGNSRIFPDFKDQYEPPILPSLPLSSGRFLHTTVTFTSDS